MFRQGRGLGSKASISCPGSGFKSLQLCFRFHLLWFWVFDLFVLFGLRPICLGWEEASDPRPRIRGLDCGSWFRIEKLKRLFEISFHDVVMVWVVLIGLCWEEASDPRPRIRVMVQA
jgi:hypothetical protein